jgi:sec-independent protein translocase protein TatC
VFQIRAVIFVLSRIGLVTATMLVRCFKHAMVGCVVCAAVLTPTTDVGNMLIIAGPIIVLYCVGHRSRVDVRQACLSAPEHQVC